MNFYLSDKGTVYISSFYNSKTIPKDIAKYQKLVFDKFDIRLNQIDLDIRHPEYIDLIMKIIDSDIYIFFDIDSIPLNENVIEEIISNIDDNTIFGVAQCDNSNNLNHIYAAPSCFAITKKLYNKLGNPSFVERQRYISNYNSKIENTKNLLSAHYIKDIGYSNKFYEEAMKMAQRLNLKLICDTAEELTYLCEELGYYVKLWYPTSSDNDIWKLGNTGLIFGNGTIYNNMIYHNFQIRNSIESERFINKCKEIINK